MGSPLLWFGEAAKFLKNTLYFDGSTVQMVVSGNNLEITADNISLTGSITSLDVTGLDMNPSGTVQSEVSLNLRAINPLDNLDYSTISMSRNNDLRTLYITASSPISSNYATINMTADSLLDTAVIDIIGTSLFLSGDLSVNRTITAGGTTGDQTINKTAGTVNIDTGTTITVTNSLVTANSLVMTTVRTNDTTAIIKNTVCAAGSFTINMNAAVTAETSIGFFVVN